MPTRIFRAGVRVLGAAMLASAAAAAHAGNGLADPLWWYAAANPQTGQTVFDVQFDEPLGMPGADALQFWLADSGNPVGRTYQVLFGDRPLTTERVIEFRRVVDQGLADIVEIRPMTWTPAPGELASAGGWGQIVASIPFTLTGQHFTMSMPTSVTGESFVYYLQVTHNGASFAGVDGMSGIVGGVPEPGTLANMLIGLGALGLLAAGRGRKVVRYLPATASKAFGLVRAIVSSVRAAPLGCLRPCSHP